MSSNLYSTMQKILEEKYKHQIEILLQMKSKSKQKLSEITTINTDKVFIGIRVKNTNGVKPFFFLARSC